MQRLRSASPTIPFLAGLLGLLLSGCIVTKDSPAPGCVESVGLPIAGGCFGKTAILDLAVEPENACLVVEVNNCNGGVLEVRNSCPEAWVMGTITVPPSDYASFDVIEEEGGAYALTEASGNFTDHIPEENVTVSMTGLLGGQEIKLSFTKTTQLCE